MELVLFIGLQASGKTSFYRTHFAATHVHVSKDRMRNNKNRDRRQRELITQALAKGQSVVVDNTNPTRAERAVYIQAAREAGFRVVGYFFRSRVEDCMRRNEGRPAERRVPLKGLLGTAGRMERPSLEEGFDELHDVWIDEGGGYVIDEWRDEDR